MALSEYQRRRYEEAKKAYAVFIKLYPFTPEDLDGEQWADITGYEGLYQVSTFGRVKSFQYKKPRIIRPQLIGQGYLAVGLHKNNEFKTVAVHKLVAQSFLPLVEGQNEIDHRYGVKFDNYVGNLRRVTSSENKIFAVEQGARKIGGEHSQASLTNEQVEWCRKVYKPRDKDFSAAALAKRLGVAQYVVSFAIHGRTYKNAQGKVCPASAKLTKEQIIYIRDNPHGLLQRELATKFGIDQGLISAVQLGKIYKHSSGQVRQPRFPRLPNDVREKIRAEYVSGSNEFGCYGLANKYGISPTTVHKIVHEK